MRRAEPVKPYYGVPVDEFDTLEKLLDGFSISRFGDGECKMLMGVSHKYETFDRTLQRLLKDALTVPRPNHIVGIPRIVPECPRALWWEPWKARFAPFLNPDVKYYSSFISRPDHAPWIEADPAFRQRLNLLWRGKTVVLVGSGRSLTPETLPGAKVLKYIQTPMTNAFVMVDEILMEIKHHKPDVAILCCGMTATVVAHMLAHTGIQCLDLGAIGQQKLWKTAMAINAGEIKE